MITLLPKEVVFLFVAAAAGCGRDDEFNGRSKSDWIRDVGDSASSVRFHAVNALGHLARNEADSGEVLPILRESLCDVNADVRNAAHAALINSSGQSREEKLLRSRCAQPSEAGRR